MKKSMWRGGIVAGLALTVMAPAAQAQQLQWTGSAWSRFEIREFSELTAGGPGDTEDPRFTLMQTRIGLARSLSPNVRFFAQIQDARRWGDEGSTTDASADRLDLHQGYFEVGVEAASPVWLRIGRQETEFGNGRLIGASEWSPVGQSFDGVRAAVRLGEDARLDLFGYQVREGQASVGADDETLWGAWGEFGLGAERRLQLFVIHDRDNATVETSRTTLGTEYHAKVGVVEYQVEAAVQTGTVSDQDLSGATLLAARISAPLLEGRGSLGAGFDRYSGDAAPGAGETGAFSDLFGRNHRFLGFADLFSDPAADTQGRGLQDFNVRGTWRLTEEMGLQVDYHRFVLVDDDGLDDGTLGDEIDVTVSGSILRGLTLLGGGAWVDPNSDGMGIRPAEQVFGYLQLKVAF